MSAALAVGYFASQTPVPIAQSPAPWLARILSGSTYRHILATRLACGSSGHIVAMDVALILRRHARGCIFPRDTSQNNLININGVASLWESLMLHWTLHRTLHRVLHCAFREPDGPATTWVARTRIKINKTYIHTLLLGHSSRLWGVKFRWRHAARLNYYHE